MASVRGARYVHTNLVARDWRRLADFYERVFGCVPVPPHRHLSGAWLERGTGIADARLEGIQLRLPGHGPDGPTLEIFTYAETEAQELPVANRCGYGHLAFTVEDVGDAVAKVREAGGEAVGEIVSATIEGRGQIQFCYVRDPEGNIIELQRWFE
jgi:catechol 2,3-dioxygenase-like lactoylglutathione lyase family enzyme